MISHWKGRSPDCGLPQVSLYDWGLFKLLSGTCYMVNYEGHVAVLMSGCALFKMLLCALPCWVSEACQAAGTASMWLPDMCVCVSSRCNDSCGCPLRDWCVIHTLLVVKHPQPPGCFFVSGVLAGFGVYTHRHTNTSACSGCHKLALGSLVPPRKWSQKADEAKQWPFILMEKTSIVLLKHSRYTVKGK